MHWFYVIKSQKNGELYFGSTNNLVRRLKEHNDNRTFSTARYSPWKFVYVEGYASREDSIHREEQVKHYGKVYAQLKRRISKSLRNA